MGGRFSNGKGLVDTAFYGIPLTISTFVHTDMGMIFWQVWLKEEEGDTAFLLQYTKR
jgi:hypothetical protein